MLTQRSADRKRAPQVEGHELAVLKNFPFREFRWDVLTIETVPPALSALLLRNGYNHLLNIKYLIMGHWKVLDRVYVHNSIQGGVQEARARAQESIDLWNAAMTKRSLRGRSVETSYGLNCGGVPEAFVATGGNRSDLFPSRVSCSCSI